MNCFGLPAAFAPDPSSVPAVPHFHFFRDIITNTMTAPRNTMGKGMASPSVRLLRRPYLWVVIAADAGASRTLSDTLCAGRDAESTAGSPDVRKFQLSTTKPLSLLALSDDDDDTSRPTNMNSAKRAPRPAASAASAGVRGRRLAAEEHLEA
uniref:Uncharacterized protein n=1 Tax=Arundo donax TaxID=35708 RepID=A0A0A9D2X7_ARUDO